MAERVKTFKNVVSLRVILANAEVAEKGNTACIDTATGECVAGQTGEGLLPFGWFTENLTGDGSSTVAVELFKEKRLAFFLNSDSPNHVAADDIGKLVYLAGPATVTTSATGNSVAGRAWIVDSTGVYVEPASDIGPAGPQGEPGV